MSESDDFKALADFIGTEGPACFICKFWGPNLAFNMLEETQGECRRRAPVAVPMHGERSATPAMWPETHGSDWCAEFEKAPEVEKPADEDSAQARRRRLRLVPTTEPEGNA